MMFLRVLVIALGFILIVLSRVFASSLHVSEMSAYPSWEAGGLANTHVWMDPSATYHNPAGLAFAQKIQFSMGAFKAFHFFHPIQDIVIQNGSIGKSVAYGDVNTNDASPSGLNTGLIFPMSYVTFGLWAYLPKDFLLNVKTQEMYMPAYGAYFGNARHFSVIAGMGFEPLKNFSLGISGNFYLTTAANTRVNVNGTNSTFDLAMDVKPAVAPILGCSYQSKTWGIAGAWHAPLDYAMSLQNTTDLVFMGTQDDQTGEIHFPAVSFLSQSALFYEPEMVQGQIDYRWIHGMNIGLGLNWKHWKKYKPSTNVLAIMNPGGMKTSQPMVAFKNIFSPSIHLEIPWRKWRFHSQYRYEPEHVETQEAQSNFLDTTTHIFNSGVSYAFKEWMGHPVTVDVQLQLDQLETRKIRKENYYDIGYHPDGYLIGGRVFQTGIVLSTQLPS
ncbi:MAG: hypothetical protein HY390_04480 [Deltaproteobacteria bacterium]|nr:hypothetical protein [Deltaproteobacteria bacterium]